LIFKISHLAIDSTESLCYDQNYDQQAKDTLFWNRLQCLLFLVSIAGTTGMNMSVEIICRNSFAKQIKKGGQSMLFRFFFLNFSKIAYIICNLVFEINKPSRSLRQLFRIMSMLIS